MLKISPNQLTRLGALQREDFLRRLRAHLAGRIAARGGDPEAAALGAVIDQGLAEARRFGFHTEADVVRLIELRTAARPDQPAPPPTEDEIRILSWHGPSPQARLDRYAATQGAEAADAPDLLPDPGALQ